MMTLVIALISSAIAFVAGGVLGKAYFMTRLGRNRDFDEDQPDYSETGPAESLPDLLDRSTHLRLVDEQRSRYQKRVMALNKVISRHEEAQKSIKEKLLEIQQTQGSKARSAAQAKAQVDELQLATNDLRDQLKARDAELARLNAEFEPLREMHEVERRKSEAAQNNANLLKIERDELKARISRMSNQSDPNSERSGQQHGALTANLRADLGQMRESLATGERRIHDLNVHLLDSQEQVKALEAQLENWKHRVSPLTRKLTQQRDIIRRLRAPANDANATEESRRPIEELIDDLKEIRGIGPALERRLNQRGIRRFEQIAALTELQLAQVGEHIAVAPTIMHRDRWVEQARSLAERRLAEQQPAS